jgi:NAD(P)-dependent dehydrogenase (short-subunit alcohol dehydrogenase family)
VVNDVAPGYVRTVLSKRLVALHLDADAAQAVVFLCSPRASHITGHVLAIDGGWTAH